MKARYVKTIEALQEHTRKLPVLNEGDYVMVQNQTGRFPTRWDKSGCVVEVKNNDQYVVKVAGTGRVTLRNRRFLRRYEHHDVRSTMPSILPTDYSPRSDPVERCHLPSDVTTQTGTPADNTIIEPDLQHPSPSPSDSMTPAVRDRLETPPVTPLLSQAQGVRSSPTRLFTPTRSLFDRRPTRKKVQRKVYDASSGKYIEPNPGDKDDKV